MSEIQYHQRRAHRLENEALEIIVTVEGGHIAAVTDKATGVNPLWKPPWPSIEPSQHNPATHPIYGTGSDAKLLAGILGHNLCLDIFGGPSEAEAAAGLGAHGEAPVLPHEITVREDTLTQQVELPQARLRFTRRMRLPAGARVAEVQETVENLTACDRPVGWTQHVTLGPPFLERGRTEFETTATASKVIEYDFANGKGHLRPGAEFNWPQAPALMHGTEDLRRFGARPVSAAYTAHYLDPTRSDAWFMAWHPTHRLAFGYVWPQRDFPWLGIWEENYSRAHSPWNGRTVARGMEFGMSPFPETRHAMLQRGSLFGVPAFGWIPARGQIKVAYRLFLVPAREMPPAPPL